jgi:hypothetical protein
MMRFTHRCTRWIRKTRDAGLCGGVLIGGCWLCLFLVVAVMGVLTVVNGSNRDRLDVASSAVPSTALQVRCRVCSCVCVCMCVCMCGYVCASGYQTCFPHHPGDLGLHTKPIKDLLYRSI